MWIPFNWPYATGKELDYIRQAIDIHHHISGDGAFTPRCQGWLEKSIGCKKALLVHSGTAALEMAALLADIQPGDEIIMPSFTFVTTANAFVLRGGVPVFVDIRPDTLNIDETLIEAAITEKTRAIVPVHYGGVACEMDAIMAIAEKHNLLVIEDAAHTVGAFYNNKPLGSFGHMAALSFHETKNLSCGEGGALLINKDSFAARAEIIREKGTNRSQFFRGEVDKYTWVDVGSSYPPSDIQAAFLWAQMEQYDRIMATRLAIWNRYHQKLEGLEQQGLLRRPVVPAHCSHNAHLYYVLVPDAETRTRLIAHLKKKSVNAVFHYVPLHQSPAGKRFSRVSGSLPHTEQLSERLVRLPMWAGLTTDNIQQVCDEVGTGLQVSQPSLHN